MTAAPAARSHPVPHNSHETRMQWPTLLLLRLRAAERVLQLLPPLHNGPLLDRSLNLSRALLPVAVDDSHGQRANTFKSNLGGKQMHEQYLEMCQWRNSQPEGVK